MLGTRLIIRFATAKRWRRALDSEWATGRGVVSCKSPLAPGTQVELRIFIASTHLDLVADVQNTNRLPDGEHHLTLSVRWSDSKRLVAESLTHGTTEAPAGPEEFPPVAVFVVSDSVPPFVIDRSALGRLPAGPGASRSRSTPLPPVAPRHKNDFSDVPETDLNLAVVPAWAGADTDALPPSTGTSPEVHLGDLPDTLSQTRAAASSAAGISANPKPGEIDGPKGGFTSRSTAASVGEHYPDRASRALELLDEARQAEARGDLREARRRAALAQAFDPVEPQVLAYLERLRRRMGR